MFRYPSELKIGPMRSIFKILELCCEHLVSNCKDVLGFVSRIQGCFGVIHSEFKVVSSLAQLLYLLSEVWSFFGHCLPCALQHSVYVSDGFFDQWVFC